MFRRLIVTMSALLMTVSCEGDDPFADGLQITGPITTESALVYVDAPRDEVLFVVPGDQRIAVERTPLGTDRRRRASWMRPTLDGSAVLVMAIPESEKDEDVEEVLFQFDADGGGEPIEHAVAAPFNAVALSPDRRRAVLYFSSEGLSTPLQNANHVSIVELGGASPHSFTLNGFGGRLTSVHFPAQTRPGVPSMVEVGGKLRDLVAFLAEGEVVLVDMADPIANQVAVTFGDASFVPVATLLRPGDDLFADPVLFLRSEYSSDVAMLTLVDHPKGEGFSTQISLVPVGVGASDFVFYNGSEVPYLVTVNVAGKLVFTDIRTHQSFEIDLDGHASRVFLRDHVGEAGPIRQAVAWAQGGHALHTLELDHIEDTLGRKPHELKIQSGIGDLVQLDNDRVLIGSGTNLYVVDFPKDQVTPLTAKAPYDARSSGLDGNLLLLGTPGQEWISSVDLASLNPESMVLDDPIATFHWLRGARKIVVTHQDPVGHLTVARADDPSRSTSYVEWGYLLEGALDR